MDKGACDRAGTGVEIFVGTPNREVDVPVMQRKRHVADGVGELDTSTGAVPFERGALAFYRGDEELRVRNSGNAELTLLAFLAPKFATG